MTIVLRCPLYEHSKQPVQPPIFCFFLFLKPSPLALLAPNSCYYYVCQIHTVHCTPYSVHFSLPSFAHVRIPSGLKPFSSPFQHRFSYWRKGLTINIWAINIESTPYAHRNKLLCLCRHHPGCIITPQSPWVAGVGPMYMYRFSLFQKT